MTATWSTRPSVCSSLRSPLLIAPSAHSRRRRHQSSASSSAQRSFLLPRPSFASAESGPASLQQEPNRQDSTPDLPSSPDPRNDDHNDDPEVSPQPPPTRGLLTYAPFARCSINVCSCSSNSGKTFFLTQIVRHRQNFFQDPTSIRRILYVNANNRDFGVEAPWSESELPGIEVVSLSLEEFKDLNSVLQANDVLIIDDVLQLTDEIQYIVKYGAHHWRLYVFILNQSCLSSPLYSLVRSAHNLVLLFGNTSTTRLAQHILQSFFFCTDTKAYLKAIFSIAERQQDTVVLKLNTVATYRAHANVLALARVQSLFAPEGDPEATPYCFIYPELGRADQLWKERDSKDHFAASAMAELPLVEGDFLDEAFVLLPASRVRQATAAGQGDAEGDGSDDCLKDKKRQWNEMALFLEKEIERSFPLKRWGPAKNLTRELLRCNDLCVSSDFRTVFLRSRPKTQFSVIDFLNVATRKAGPAERGSDKVLAFRPLVNILVKHHLPETFIVNRLLLSDQASGKERRRRRRHRDARLDDTDDTDDELRSRRSRSPRRRRFGHRGGAAGGGGYGRNGRSRYDYD